MENIKGIIFDYGGTIDSRGDHWSHVIMKAYRDAGFDIPEDAFRDAYVFGERALGRERIILPMDNFLVLLTKKMRLEMKRLVELGAIDASALEDGSPEKVAELCYESARECVREARPVLAALSEKFPLVLVSNFYGNVEEVLRDFDIRKYFNGVIESAVVGVRKPDSRIFRLGVVALGFSPGEVLVVGDSFRKDILPARQIGCRTAWLKGRGWTADEDEQEDPCQIDSLDSLLTLPELQKA